MKQSNRIIAEVYKSPTGNNDWSDKPIMLRSIFIDEFYLYSNIVTSPEKLSEWISKQTEKAKKDGWDNIQVAIKNRVVGEYDEKKSYITLIGNRMETVSECNQRVERLRSLWLRDFEEFCRKMKFYKTEFAKVRVEESFKCHIGSEDRRKEVLSNFEEVFGKKLKFKI